MNEKDAALTARLVEAVDKLAGGSADRLGRMLGYTNGGYIREIVNGKKPVRRMLIERFKSESAAQADGRLRNWFDDWWDGKGSAAQLPDDGWRMSLSADLEAPAAQSLVDDIADRLLALPAAQHDAAVDACRRVAESPDSQRARQNLAALIGAGPARADKDFQLPPALGMLADRWPVDGEREVIQRFLETVTQFMAEHRASPNPGSGTQTPGQRTKASARDN